jgi:hypothetical protein
MSSSYSYMGGTSDGVLVSNLSNYLQPSPNLFPIGDTKLFPYGLPDPVSFDANFADERSTLIVLAVGRY